MSGFNVVLSDSDKHKRLDFAKKHVALTSTAWREMIFSDEQMFQ